MHIYIFSIQVFVLYQNHFCFFFSEFPNLPKLPQIQLVRKEKSTANGIDDFSVFSLRCQLSIATETNVKYELQWVINGDVSKSISFSSTDVKSGQFESVLSGNSLKALKKIDQVSELFTTTLLFIHGFIYCYYEIYNYFIVQNTSLSRN